MRKTVCKRLRKHAALFPHETKAGIRTTIKRYFTGKFDDKGKEVIQSVKKNTVEFTGRQRVYQGLKAAYRLARMSGACTCVGGFISRSRYRPGRERQRQPEVQHEKTARPGKAAADGRRLQ